MMKVHKVRIHTYTRRGTQERMHSRMQPPRKKKIVFVGKVYYFYSSLVDSYQVFDLWNMEMD